MSQQTAAASNIDAIDAVVNNTRSNGAMRAPPILDQITPEPELPVKKLNAPNRIASPTPTATTDTAPKSKKPKSTALKQQRLPAWQPILTANTVLPLFFVVGGVFVVLGSIILHFSNTVDEFSYDYTYCRSWETGEYCYEFKPNVTYSNGSSAYWSNWTNASTCECLVTFKLNKTFEGPVFIYYGLRNFYQNHRRYVKSRDDNQLLGKPVTKDNISSECAPYGSGEGQKVYAPCGAIANSLFNDTFDLSFNGDDNSTDVIVPLLRTGIAWSSDKNVKFGQGNYNNTLKPKNWLKRVDELDLEDPSNNGYQNEDLIVWMRTAALPNFRKLFRRVDHSVKNFTNGLPAGYYSLIVKYSKFFFQRKFSNYF